MLGFIRWPCFIISKIFNSCPCEKETLQPTSSMFATKSLCSWWTILRIHFAALHSSGVTLHLIRNYIIHRSHLLFYFASSLHLVRILNQMRTICEHQDKDWMQTGYKQDEKSLLSCEVPAGCPRIIVVTANLERRCCKFAATFNNHYMHMFVLLTIFYWLFFSSVKCTYTFYK